MSGNFKGFKRYTIVITLLLSFIGLHAQEKISEAPLSIGKQLKIKSETLGEERTLNIYLPESYSAAVDKSYPVVYLLDGSMDEDFIHITGLVQFCSFSWINILPESIVVGIGNVDRKRDFTYPSSVEQDQQEFPTSGKSEAFISFIEDELQPFIDKEFRTGKSKTLIGQSLGGLLATEVLLKKPWLFSKYIIVSPSLWWDNENLLQIQPIKQNYSPYIYIAGGKEGEIMERVAKSLYSNLQKHDFSENIHYNYYPNKSHGDVLHQAVYDAFEIFKKK